MPCQTLTHNHHKKQTFREEYLDILKRNADEYDGKYIFHDLLDGQG
jgi:putative transposase